MRKVLYFHIKNWEVLDLNFFWWRRNWGRCRVFGWRHRPLGPKRKDHFFVSFFKKNWRKSASLEPWLTC